MEPSARSKVTGVYGGDRVPGTYIKTRTGVVRGEELFCRPDRERPWRSADQQRHAAVVALKEKEIEELMRLCSSLRTELGNARSDTRHAEYSSAEAAKAQMSESEADLVALRARVAELEAKTQEQADSTESQIRLLRSQAENEAVGLKNEARIANERCTDLTNTHQRQLEEVRAIAVRELEFVESRFKARVAELEAELKSLQQLRETDAAHHREQEAQSANMVHKIESDYQERLRSSEQRIEEQRTESEAQLAKERAAKEKAAAELRRLTEQHLRLSADREDLMQKQKLWNGFLLAQLDTIYRRCIAVSPEVAVEPVGMQLQQLPALYAPRCILEDAEAKVTVERIAYRVTQMKQMRIGGAGLVDETEIRMRLPTVAELDRVAESQERLRRALQESEEHHRELDGTVGAIASRLFFFSDNLEEALRQQHGPAPVPPPMRDVIFVCLNIVGGRVLWAAEPDTMRTAVQLLYGALRLKMGEYGAYECHSDDAAMLLAFADAAGACRFCCESQTWLMRLPWPEALLRRREAAEVRDAEGGVVLSGLRVAMALHAGEAFVEPTGIPGHGGYRNHYYGRAVSQMVRIASFAQGGQILSSAEAWRLCEKYRHDLGDVATASLGSVPVVFFDCHAGMEEQQEMELLQLTPASLAGRTFAPLHGAKTPAVDSTTGVAGCVLSAEVAGLEAQRERLQTTLTVLREECINIQREVGSLISRARAGQPHFHALPPPDMVAEMNDLYGVMERVATRTEELYADLQDVARTQEEVEAEAQGIKQYVLHHEATMTHEDDLRTEAEATRMRLEQEMQTDREKHRVEVDRLLVTVQEREHALRQRVAEPTS